MAENEELARAEGLELDENEERLDLGVGDERSVRRGLGVASKIFLLLLFVLVVLAAATAFVSARTVSDALDEQFRSRGEAIASGLATSAVDLVLSRDASTIQARIDQFAATAGVEYVLVQDRDGKLIAHTFAPFVPEGLVEQNTMSGAEDSTVSFNYTHPETLLLSNVIDIGKPVLAGELGFVRVGMNQDEITLTVRDSIFRLLTVAGLVALAGAILGWIFTTVTTRPISRLVRVARRVGEGDLSELATVTSSDEIGLLSNTLNDTIIRLRDQVRTEEERDAEKRQREDLQNNITRFLDVAVEIADGDLTKRGEVTSDVLGAVVDSINVMVEEIGNTLGEVRQVASTVSMGAQEMISVTGEMVDGARAQTEDAQRAEAQTGEVNRVVRDVSESAGSSAQAARQTLQAAERGQQAVELTREGMQRIRREVQTISKRIKSLGDRSMEISEVIDAISSISSQTNLLALNAAIEASGAGEEGARFAVVADEVRKLAEDSATATKRIASLIQGVQAEIQEAVSAMEEGTREVEAGFRVTSQADEQLRDIAEISRTSAELAQQISSAAAQQVESVEKVSQSVESIAQVTQRSELSVQRGRGAAEQLVELSSELEKALARFRLAS